MNRPLYRSIADRRIGGVAAGTAAFFDIDPSIARVLWVLLAIFSGGAFVIVYLVMWAIIPEEPWAPDMPGAVQPVASEGGEGATPPGEGAATSGSAASPRPRPSRGGGPGGNVILGAILVVTGAWFLVREFLPGLNWDLVWPVGLVIIGVLILAAAVRRGS